MESEMDPSQRPLRVFLCHSSGDKPVVRLIYRWLAAQNGVKPWLDEEELLPGQEWEREIRGAVRSADLILVCLSSTSVNKAGFLQREIRLALEVATEQPPEASFIIPIRLEECKVPEELSKWQWFDYYNPRGHERLLRALAVRAEALGLGPAPAAFEEILPPPDTIAPDGAETRMLAQGVRGSLSDYFLPPGRIGPATYHQTVEELWYFTGGIGQLWLRRKDSVEIREVRLGMAVFIEVGTHFQLRALGPQPLRFVIVTMPPWPGYDESVNIEGHWKLPSLDAATPSPMQNSS